MVNPGSLDRVADLNYANRDMRTAAIKRNDVLGYRSKHRRISLRCRFTWSATRFPGRWPSYLKERLFMLAEAEIPALMQGDSLSTMSMLGRHPRHPTKLHRAKEVNAFDSYAGDGTKEKLGRHLMNFVTSHDENVLVGNLPKKSAWAMLPRSWRRLPMPYTTCHWFIVVRNMTSTIDSVFFGKIPFPKPKESCGLYWPAVLHEKYSTCIERWKNSRFVPAH